MVQVGESYDGVWKRFLKTKINVNNTGQFVSGYHLVGAAAAVPLFFLIHVVNTLLHGSFW